MGDKPRGPGRPAAGVRPGERVRDYPMLNVRIPPDTHAMLRVLSDEHGMPQWQMLRRVVAFFVQELPAGTRRLVRRRTMRRDPAEADGRKRAARARRARTRR